MVATAPPKTRRMTVHRTTRQCGITQVALTTFDDDAANDYHVTHRAGSSTVRWAHDEDRLRCYVVTLVAGRPAGCTCPHWVHRGSKSGKPCRHISATASLIARHHLTPEE